MQFVFKEVITETNQTTETETLDTSKISSPRSSGGGGMTSAAVGVIGESMIFNWIKKVF